MGLVANKVAEVIARYELQVEDRVTELEKLLDRAMTLAQSRIDFHDGTYDVAEFAWIDHDFKKLTGHDLPCTQQPLPVKSETA